MSDFIMMVFAKLWHKQGYSHDAQSVNQSHYINNGSFIFIYYAFFSLVHGK